MLFQNSREKNWVRIYYMERAASIPSHIPAERLVDADVFALAGAQDDIHMAWRRLAENHDMVWTPHYGGHWIATGPNEIERLYRDVESFSNREIGIPPGSMLIPMLPIQADGEEHRRYRQVIEPAFKPAALQRYAQEMRQMTIELIERFQSKGRCEFTGEYAAVVPLAIFLSMVGLPHDDRELLHGFTETMARDSDMAKRHAAFGGIMDYLKMWIERRREAPGDDLLSTVVHARFDGRPATDTEVLGLAGLLLFGGLDTVSSMMGFVMRFLADNPGHRAWIIDNPTKISPAIEEIMRRYGVANSTREAKFDVSIGGVTVRKGELILVPPLLHGLDERAFDRPLDVDFARAPQRNATFGMGGPHHCPGMNLARLEMRIMVEEWLKRIPDFEVDPDEEIVQSTGGVNGITRLPLRWRVNPAANSSN